MSRFSVFCVHQYFSCVYNVYCYNDISVSCCFNSFHYKGEGIHVSSSCEKGLSDITTEDVFAVTWYEDVSKVVIDWDALAIVVLEMFSDEADLAEEHTIVCKYAKLFICSRIL